MGLASCSTISPRPRMPCGHSSGAPTAVRQAGSERQARQWARLWQWAESEKLATMRVLLCRRRPNHRGWRNYQNQ